MGVPDLIESSLPLAFEGDEMWLSMFPPNVFTKPLREGQGGS